MSGQHLAPSLPLVPHYCGSPAHLVAVNLPSTGHAVDGLPSLLHFHVECPACGVATPPSYSKATAEALWRIHDVRPLVPVSKLPALRAQAEEQLRAQVAA